MIRTVLFQIVFKTAIDFNRISGHVREPEKVVLQCTQHLIPIPCQVNYYPESHLFHPGTNQTGMINCITKEA